ncbi:envelope stress response membrane protein PspC [Paraferrimonas sedimenticola]|uniref:Phage-shock protein n=1 Tax=Paraferrimonas sedimenticola TaxID=375674 RepID=A0AA37RL01_9GAMM|nr:envelope stress response membrane protein PspC [Paraferrimonas sedimenticola]GLP94835.1 phage-shock protein [Paraferrimonas sedimenticola]
MTSRKGKRELYRDPANGKIAGVCAGIAEYFNVEVWLVRVVTLSAFLLGWFSGLPLILYIAAWAVLDKKPAQAQREEMANMEVKKKLWQAGEPPKQALRDINRNFRALELKLRRMEQHVTTDSFHLKREIDNL